MNFTTKEGLRHLKRIKDILIGIEKSNSLYVDWENVALQETVDNLIYNAENFDKYFQPPIAYGMYYEAICDNCGWWGSSEYLMGGQSIADTGDYDDVYCPICHSKNINDK